MGMSHIKIEDINYPKFVALLWQHLYSKYYESYICTH